MSKIVEILVTFVLGIIVILGLSILFAYPIMLLWNWLMPEIFGLTTITFWQAWGLNILSSFLLKGLNYNKNEQFK